MIKILTASVLMLLTNTAFSQWVRVDQLPSSDIFSMYRSDSLLLAGGTDAVYYSTDGGNSWDSTEAVPGVTSVDGLAVFGKDWIASSYGTGVFLSGDMGKTWINISNGIEPYVSEFCTWEGNLYAATLGYGVFRFDTNSWTAFNSGLGTLSFNVPTIAATDRVMVAGTGANSLYDRLPADSTTWDEQFFNGDLNPGEGVFDIVPAQDTLFMATYHACYISTDEASTWTPIGDQMNATSTTLLNAKQALLIARDEFGGLNITQFYYLRKDSLRDAPVLFSTVNNHFTYGMSIFGNRIWDASSAGLFYMPLSLLPGITDAASQDSMAIISNNKVGQLYPNPAPVQVNVALSVDSAVSLSARVYDMAGRLVSIPADHLALAKGGTVFSFPVAQLSAGVYVLRLDIGQASVTRKFIHIP